MKFIDLVEVYNERITPDVKNDENEIGVNDVWFEEIQYPMVHGDGVKCNSFALEDVEIKLDIRACRLFFYCFSENQVITTHVIVNHNTKYQLKVCDWGNEYIPEEDRDSTRVFCRSSANNGMKLAIYENVLDMKGKMRVQSLQFNFSPAIHIIAIGYE